SQRPATALANDRPLPAGEPLDRELHGRVGACVDAAERRHQRKGESCQHRLEEHEVIEQGLANRLTDLLLVMPALGELPGHVEPVWYWIGADQSHRTPQLERQQVRDLLL